MSEINLNDVVEETVRDSDVITVPVDTTLTHSGEAADAKTVGDALALKADKSELAQSIQVNGQSADEQGLILVNAGQIPMSASDETSVAAKVAEIDGKTGASIPLSAGSAQTIEQAFNGIGAKNAENIPMSATDSTTVAAKITDLESKTSDIVKTVNGEEPDAQGNVEIDEVNSAKNLTSNISQATRGAFILRTTGGSRNVGSGSAQLQEVRGAILHTGEVKEVLERDVTGADITAAIDRDVFVAVVTESAVLVFTYSSGWQLNGEAADPEDYGITITGTPANGDEITVTYVKGDRGTIMPATPSGMKATGWNLYNPSVGYARVVGYDGAYHIGGNFSSIQFSETQGGMRSALSVQNGSFRVPGDGYVWVNGASAANTYITTEWTDWTTGPDVQFEAYSETGVDFSAVMTAYFPNGLLAVGATYDSISIDQSRAISRIERLEYDDETIAEIIAQGREYEADEDYIYVIRTSAESHDISISGQYTVSDHGIEMIDGTTVPPMVVILYGQNLIGKLINEVVTSTPQDWSEEAKQQIRENIGAQEAMEFADITATAWTWGNSYATGDSPSVSFLKLGRFRMLRFTIAPKNAQTTWTTIGTIAEGNRPQQFISTYAAESKSSPTPKHIRIKPDGSCEIFARAVSTYSANMIWFV